MNEAFEFVSSRCQGLARFGSVEASVRALVNSCVLMVEPSRFSEGSIEPNDAISVYVISSDIRFEAFRGVVSRVKLDAGFVRVECVTTSSYAKVDFPGAMSWQNATAQRVLLDLLAKSRLPITNLNASSTLSDIFLHSWHTEGRSVADEALSLLHSVAPDVLVYGAPDGRTLIGTREEIAKTFSALVFPSDSQTGGSDTDILRYSLRVAFPGVAYTDSAGNFLGTLECVVHEIAPGRAYTSLLLDEEYSSDLSAWVGSNVVKEVN